MLEDPAAGIAGASEVVADQANPVCGNTKA